MVMVGRKIEYKCNGAILDAYFGAADACPYIHSVNQGIEFPTTCDSLEEPNVVVLCFGPL